MVLADELDQGLVVAAGAEGTAGVHGEGGGRAAGRRRGRAWWIDISTVKRSRGRELDICSGRAILGGS